MYPLYPQQMMNSWKPKWEYIFMMCHRIGLPPFSIIGLGLRWLSSLILVPFPPANITTFIRGSSAESQPKQSKNVRQNKPEQISFAFSKETLSECERDF